MVTKVFVTVTNHFLQCGPALFRFAQIQYRLWPQCHDTRFTTNFQGERGQRWGSQRYIIYQQQKNAISLYADTYTTYMLW